MEHLFLVYEKNHAPRSKMWSNFRSLFHKTLEQTQTSINPGKAYDLRDVVMNYVISSESSIITKLKSYKF